MHRSVRAPLRYGGQLLTRRSGPCCNVRSGGSFNPPLLERSRSAQLKAEDIDYYISGKSPRRTIPAFDN
ncbi:hypothetical protein Plhal304r1_c023g0080501 [Plasmopara halstedii]